MNRATMRPTAPRREAIALLIAGLVVGGCGSSAPPPSAADQVPHLAVVLERIDSALAAHHFGVALQQLRALKADVVKARDAGDLQDADAARVLAAAASLIKVVPVPTATPTTTPETSSATPSAEPSRPEPSKTRRPVSPSPTPSPSPSSTPTTSSPSPSPTSSPDATPTGGATRDTSPTASPTSGP